MSSRITKLTVGKGKTTGNEKASEWLRQYYQVEVEIQDEKDIEVARASVEGLLDIWLRGESVVPKKEIWDPSKIKWTTAEGSSGLYERSEDVNSIDFKEAMKDLEAHGGKLSRKDDGATWFYWKFEKSPIIGRKKRK